MEWTGLGESTTAVGIAQQQRFGSENGRFGWRPKQVVREQRQRYGGSPCFATLTVSDLSSSSSNKLQEGFGRHFNNLIRRHCDRVPLGWASISRGGGVGGEGGLGDDVDGAGKGGEKLEATGEEETQPSGKEEKTQKSVLILMSDTGGGHRASAEAIKSTFELEYGDEYKVLCAVLGFLFPLGRLCVRGA